MDFSIIKDWFHFATNDFSVIRDWANFAANICILSITFYTFFITFISKKIKFRSIKSSYSISEGNSFSIVLENKTLSPMLIDNINLIVDNTYKMKIKEFDTPFILEPFTAKKITSPKHSYTVPNLEASHISKSVLEVECADRKQYIPLHKKTPKVSNDMKKIRTNVEIITNKYNGKIVPEYAKYALIVSNDDWHITSFIFESGVMTEQILEYNGLPSDVLKDTAELDEFLSNWLKPKKLNYHVVKVSEKFGESPNKIT